MKAESVVKYLKEREDLLKSSADNPPNHTQMVILFEALGFKQGAPTDHRWVWMYSKDNTEIAVPKIQQSRDYKRRILECISDAVNTMGWHHGMVQEIYIKAKEITIED